MNFLIYKDFFRIFLDLYYLILSLYYLKEYNFIFLHADVAANATKCVHVSPHDNPHPRHMVHVCDCV